MDKLPRILTGPTRPDPVGRASKERRREEEAEAFPLPPGKKKDEEKCPKEKRDGERDSEEQGLLLDERA